MRRVWVVLVVALYGVLAVECRPHPLSAARTQDSYLGKANTTIESALAEVQTARLTARIAGKEHTFTPYAAGAIADAEEALSGLQGTFDSIQPPTGGDDIRDEVDELLGDAVDHASDLRVAARRGEDRSLADVGKPLADDARAMRRYLEENDAS